MAVIRDPVTVDGDTDLDPDSANSSQKSSSSRTLVRMDPQVEAAYPTQRRMKLRDNPLRRPPPASRGSRRARDLHDAQSVRSRIFSDASRRPRDHLIRDGLGAGTPALIRGLVNITMITCEIAATVYLKDELADGASAGWPGGTDGMLTYGLGVAGLGYGMRGWVRTPNPVGART